MVMSSLINKLSGKERRKIRQAIISAYPNIAELRMMVDDELNCNLDSIAGDSNLEQVVFNLINTSEAQGWLEDLIRAAIKSNPGNSDLKVIAEKLLPDISLLKILKPFEHKYMKEMYEVYKAIYYESYSDNVWDNETPNNLNELLEKIIDIPNSNHEESILQFLVSFLIKTEKELTPIKDELIEWGELHYSNNFSQLLDKERNKIQQKEQEQKNKPSYLIVVLKPHLTDKELYFFQAWFIPNGEIGKFHPQTGQGYIPLTLEKEGYKKFEETKIANFLASCFNQICEHSTFSRGQTKIQFFLPYELLNQPIDNWKIPEDEDDIPSPIGREYNVILRLYKRLIKYKHTTEWKKKWDNLEKSHCSECFVSVDDYNCEELYEKLYQEVLKKSIACRLMKPPSGKILKYINKSAIPAALWIREELEKDYTQTELNQLFEFSMIELPEKIRDKRQDAAGDSDKRSHIGNHISLLWENPYILPPKIEYK